MSSLNDIAIVNIALNTAVVASGNFGTPLIASPHASASNRVLSYTSYDDAVDDNLPAQLLIALSDAFAQTPHPTTVKVGRLSLTSINIAPVDAVAGKVYSLVLGTTTVSVTAAATPTTSTIATQLATAINNASLGVTATATAGTVALVFTNGLVVPSAFNNVQWDIITPSTVAGIMATDLAAIAAEDNDWYNLLLSERTPARVLAAAAWTETQDKIFGTATADTNAPIAGNTTDVVSQLQALGYNRTYAAYQSHAASEYPDAAWASRVLTIQPGAETWALKKLSSVTPDKISTTAKNAVLAKGGNTFEYYTASIALTNPGKVVSGEWIDVIRFRDYLKNLIQTNLVTLMINRDKVPYTDGGIQLLANNIKSSLQTGQTVGGIAPDELDDDGNTVPGFILTVPVAADISASVKGSRIVYFSFVARLAGAIHVATITGSLAYEFN